MRVLLHGDPVFDAGPWSGATLSHNSGLNPTTKLSPQWWSPLTQSGNYDHKLFSVAWVDKVEFQVTMGWIKADHLVSLLTVLLSFVCAT
ncbi:MAG TPA: hypothetical protein VMF91_07050 [Bryobacteraceae bacterium]|nr:hypothetical protein [Bryobacteraceae bacterium]